MVYLDIGERVTYRTTVREIVEQLRDGLRDFETNEDYLLLEVLAVEARAVRQEKEQDAIKELPLFQTA